MTKYKTELLDFQESDNPLLGKTVGDNTLCLQARLNEWEFQVKMTETPDKSYEASTELLVMHENEPGVVARLFLLNLPDTIAAAQAVAEDITGAEVREIRIQFEEPFKVWSVEYEDYLVVRDSAGLENSGVGCKITAYPDETARIYLYDSRRRGPLPLEGYVQSVPMGRRILESVSQEATG